MCVVMLLHFKTTHLKLYQCHKDSSIYKEELLVHNSNAIVCIMGLKPSPLGKPHVFKFRKSEKWNTKLEVNDMENYRKSAHCTYDIKYHLVWITKYRKPVITGQIALRTRELIRIIC